MPKDGSERIGVSTVYTQAVDPASIYNDSRYHSCFIFLFVDILYTTGDCYHWLLLVTTTGIYHSCLLPVAIIGIYHGCLLPAHITSGHYWYILHIIPVYQYILQVSITGKYYQWPLLVYTTMFITSDYYWWLLLVYTTYQSVNHIP